ncbi:MAG: hypothetical protein HYT21_01820 [Candidatus Nealsonbacteria bacterium]|nr:hypothetical protein [Candidatus Nealsonbacteria bacterium]
MLVVENKGLPAQAGVIVIIATLALAVILLLGSYFLTFTLTESRIARSQEVATKTYYLSEAGINEAIWKLKNDPIWKNSFEESPGCDSWGASFSRSYEADSATEVSIQNNRCAEGEIIATSTIALGPGKTAQRVIRVGVLKALGSLTVDSPVFAGAPSGESTIQASNLNVNSGNMFVNNALKIQLWSNVNVDGKVLTVGNLLVSDSSSLDSEAECSQNICNTTSTCGCLDSQEFSECTNNGCAHVPVEITAIDFNSNDPASYKNKAQAAQDQGQCSILGKDFLDNPVLTSNQCIFSENEFEDLLWQVGQNGKLILEHMTNGSVVSTYYVEGKIDLAGGRALEINGALIAERTVNIGEKSKWGDDFGFNHITINDPGVGFPSGLISQGKINFGPYSSFQETNITGLIYAEDEIRMNSLPLAFNITGGIIARKFSLTSAWAPLNLYLDNDIIREGVWGGSQPPGGEGLPYSQIVTIEHWEESY